MCISNTLRHLFVFEAISERLLFCILSKNRFVKLLSCLHSRVMERHLDLSLKALEQKLLISTGWLAFHNLHYITFLINFCTPFSAFLLALFKQVKSRHLLSF